MPTTPCSAFIRRRHADTLFSEDGSTIDEQVGELLTGHTIAVAESCTGGGLATRLTDRAGASAYFLGGGVVYSNEAKIDLAGVDPDLIERFGAVSTEVADALAEGIARRFDADARRRHHRHRRPRRGHRRQAGRASSASRSGAPTDGRLTRRTRLPGGRADIRDRSVTVAMHLLRRLLLGESDAPAARAAVDP